MEQMAQRHLLQTQLGKSDPRLKESVLLFKTCFLLRASKTALSAAAPEK